MDGSRRKAGGIGTVLPIPILAIRQLVCISCFKIPTAAAPLSKCGACKRVSYCSAACQKQNWSECHKKTCKILIASNKRKVRTTDEERTWEVYRQEKLQDVLQFRAENPGYDEQDLRLLMYEAYCRHCYRTSPQLKTGEKLKGCEACLLTIFCSTCPQTHERDECTMFQQIGRDEDFAIQHHRRTGENFIIMCTEATMPTYLPLSTAANWYEYYSKISDKSMMSDKISPEMQVIDPSEKRSHHLLGLLRYNTSTLTLALTIIAALEAIFPDLGNRTTLKLHFVGAASRELTGLMVYEELLHLLPSLKTLELTFVGIDIPKQASEEVGPRKRMQLECCPPCTSAKRTRSLALYQGVYHDYVKLDGYEKPDLAVAFHSGFSQEEQVQWKPTIDLLAEAQHSTLFTSYNKNEMEEEMGLLRSRGAMFMKEGELNKWRSMIPILEAVEKKEKSVYYLNQYWYIVTPKQG